MILFYYLLLAIYYSAIIAHELNKNYEYKSELSQNNQIFYRYLPPAIPAHDVQIHSNIDEEHHNKHVVPPSIALLPPTQKTTCSMDNENLLLAALLLSTSLGLHPKAPGYNHPEHLPLNPYLSLLLSHYGKSAPVYGRGRGIYGYNAVNNYHNNKPFGAYKIYEDNDS